MLTISLRDNTGSLPNTTFLQMAGYTTMNCSTVGVAPAGLIRKPSIVLGFHVPSYLSHVCHVVNCEIKEKNEAIMTGLVKEKLGKARTELKEDWGMGGQHQVFRGCEVYTYMDQARAYPEAW
jgi:hypothetical protein